MKNIKDFNTFNINESLSSDILNNIVSIGYNIDDVTNILPFYQFESSPDYNDIDSGDSIGNGWIILGKGIGIGKKNRLYADCFIKTNDIDLFDPNDYSDKDVINKLKEMNKPYVYILDDGNDRNCVICGDKKEYVELFMNDFDINGDIEDIDSFEQEM